jgi:type IV pilus assembly protein PilQ
MRATMNVLRCLKVFGALAVLLPLTAAAPQITGMATVTGVQVGETAGGVLVALNADREITYLDYYLSEPGQIVIECPDAVLGFPEDMLEANDPAGPVKGVNVVQWSGDDGDNLVRLIVDLETPAPYIIENNEAGLELTVRSPEAEPIVTLGGGMEELENWAGDDLTALSMPVTLDVQKANIHTVLRSLAEYSGKDIVASSDVEGKVTVRLREVPWSDALSLVLRSHELGCKEEEDGVLRVGTLERLRKEELDREGAARQKEALLPLETKIVPLKFANAEELSKSLDDALGPRGKIEVDERTNSLLITDISRETQKISDMAMELDSRTPQVEITAKLVDLDAKVTRELGVMWEQGNVHFSDDDISLAGGVEASIGEPVGTFKLGVVQSFGQLDATLQALEKENKADIISNPRIATVNNREARILVGQKIQLIVMDEAGNPITQLITVGIQLKVIPHVNSDRTITLDLHPEVSDLAAEGTVQGGVIINTNEADTRVLVTDGETAVIGGLISTRDTELNRGVPFLRSIPFVGRLFESSSTVSRKRELLIFVTPKIMSMD